MKLNLNSPFTAKAMTAFAVLMALLYLVGGVYFMVLGSQKGYWPGILMGVVFILYGSFRTYRIYQNYRDENN